MTKQEIGALANAQREYFRTGATLPLSFRKEQLKKLYLAVKNHEAEIADALLNDLGKSRFEGFMCEAGLALTEISHMIKHLRRYARKTRDNRIFSLL